MAAADYIRHPSDRAALDPAELALEDRAAWQALPPLVRALVRLIARRERAGLDAAPLREIARAIVDEGDAAPDRDPPLDLAELLHGG